LEVAAQQELTWWMRHRETEPRTRNYGREAIARRRVGGTTSSCWARRNSS
jgi:hypothetical protein